MKKLLGIRTVYDIDPSKTFRVADILEAGAILPHSVNIGELMVADLDTECACFDFIGDNPDCKEHGNFEGSDTSMMSQLQDAGFGSGGVM